MPKRSKKSNNKSGRAGGVGGETVGSDDDSVFNDNASIISLASDSSYPKEEVLGDDGNDDIGQEELFEEKLKETIDAATQKSASGRVNALQGLCKAFMKKFTPDFVEDRYVTLTDIIDKAIKKGKASEQIVAANLSTSLCIQLGLSTSSEEVYKTLKPTFLTALNDNAVSTKARAAIAQAIGNCCFLAGGEIAEFLSIMEVLEKILTAGRKNDLNSDVFAFHTSTVSSWSLLLSMVPSHHSFTFLESHVKNLGRLLESPDVDLRISAGEALAVLYESASQHSADEAFDAMESLCDKLKELATDSNKYRSKKDRKEQRSSFRDILKTIEEGQVYFEKISINSREVLSIEGWTMKKQYDSLCKVLLSGVNLHLTENELIRDIFGLGPPVPALSALQTNKPSKHAKQLVNSQAFKHRTRTRGKERDKRTAVI